MRQLIMISSLLIILTGCGGGQEYKDFSETSRDMYLVGSLESNEISSEAIDILNTPVDDDKVHIYENGESILFTYQKDNVLFDSERSVYQDFYFSDGANEYDGFYQVIRYNPEYPELYAKEIEQISNYKFMYNDELIDTEINEVDFNI